MASFLVARFEPNEAGASAQIYLKAYEASPMHNIAFPLGNTPTFFREESERERQSIVREQESQVCFLLAIVDTSLPSSSDDIYHHRATGGTIVAKANWSLQDSESAVVHHEDFGSEANVAAVERFLEMYDRRRSETMRGRGLYWYLGLMACRPDQQRRGVGTEGVKWGLRRAREMGVPCYLSASQAGRGLYARWGFRTVWTESVDCSEFGVDETHSGTGMIWEPTENANKDLGQ